jgi:hypothetical protein
VEGERDHLPGVLYSSREALGSASFGAKKPTTSVISASMSRGPRPRTSARLSSLMRGFWGQYIYLGILNPES